jgi:hypothetical protein
LVQQKYDIFSNLDDIPYTDEIDDENTALNKDDYSLVPDNPNPSPSSVTNAVSPLNGSLQPPSNTVDLLHPSSAEKPTKKRNYATSVWNRIMSHAPRKKKAGCAYEKRLSLEIKAAKTVAIVTGCFIFCWLGFSILYGFSIETNEVVWSVVFWLGYLNSALNPVIYTGKKLYSL